MARTGTLLLVVVGTATLLGRGSAFVNPSQLKQRPSRQTISRGAPATTSALPSLTDNDAPPQLVLDDDFPAPTEAPSLPQDAKDSAARQAYLARQNIWRYSTEYTPRGSPYLDGAPVADWPLVVPDEWKLAAAKAVAPLINQKLFPLGHLVRLLVRGINLIPDSVTSWLARKIIGIFKVTTNKRSPADMLSVNTTNADNTMFALESLLGKPKAAAGAGKKKAQQKLNFKSISELKSAIFGFGKLPLPDSAKDFSKDSTFARYRLSGPNAIMIRPCTPAVRKAMPALDHNPKYSELRKNIDKSMASNTLYAINYTDFAGLQNSYIMVDGENVTQFLAPGIALFELNADEALRQTQPLVPLAIQLVSGRDASAKSAPIFTPLKEPAEKSGDYSWEIAKAAITSSDGAYHEGVTHLGLTHLVVEAFVPATNKNLHFNHPLFRLLNVHFTGSLLINYGAAKFLMAPNGTVAELISLDIDTASAYITQKVLNKLSEDFSFPALISARKMSKSEFPFDYPYRDDGMLLWDAISEWVTEYFSVYYGSAAPERERNIFADTELQAWVKDLVKPDGGNVGWLKDWAKTNDKFGLLCKVVSSLIFTGSAQHAAVNFPQYHIMSFAPAYPLGIYKDVPADDSPKTEQEYMDYLGPLYPNQQQASVGQLLGGLYYSKLGHYDKKAFLDERLEKPMADFLQKLKDATKTIKARNAKRPHAYTTLLPDNVPQSINI